MQDIRRARNTIAHLALRTPILPALSLGRIAGCELFLKAENLQRAGSFKVRGAANKIAILSPDQKASGVIAASAGNHAQGVALAASNLGIPCTIVMPTGASIPKVEATGATVRRCFSLLVEGAGAVGFAAVLGGRIQVAGKKVAVVLSGGNVDAHLIARVVEHGLSHAGRYLVIRIMLEDRPGQLNHLLNIISSLDVNVPDIGHLRHAPSVHMGQVEIQLTLETRNYAHTVEVLERLCNAGYTPYESEPVGGPAWFSEVGSAP